MRFGLLEADMDTDARSPIEAVRMFYDNVRRVTARDEKRGFRGNIVVNNTYVYDGDIKDREAGRDKKARPQKSSRAARAIQGIY